jgi:5-methylcytosine-specific restriction protein A
MPRAAKVCSEPGCPNLQPCPEHRKVPWQGSTRSQRLPRGWRKLRRFVLSRDPLCRICGQTPSTECDHIVPGDDHSLDNLQGVCGPCHTAKTQKEASEARA